MNVLYGVIYKDLECGGATTLHDQNLRALGKKVNLNLLVVDFARQKYAKDSRVEIGNYLGLPALYARRNDIKITKFTAPGENEEIENFINKISEALKILCIDLVYLTEWEEMMGVSILEAANRARVPVVLTPVDYRLICGAFHLFYKAMKLCDGPDKDFKKCAYCFTTRRPLGNGIIEKMKVFAKETIYFSGLCRFTNPFYNPAMWKKRANTVIKYASNISRIVTFSDGHSLSLSKWTGIPISKFHTIHFTNEPPSGYITDPSRYKRPLKFGWLHTLHRRWGFEFVVKAWNKADIDENQAKFYVFILPEFIKYAKSVLKKYKKIIDRGSLVIKNIVVRENEMEVFPFLAAWVMSPLWDLPSSGFDFLNRNMPVIAPDIPSWKEVVREGHNGFLYKRGNIDSLADVFKKLSYNPSALEEASKNCLSKPEYTLENYANKYVDLFKEILNER